jgi:hypothetical protein
MDRRPLFWSLGLAVVYLALAVLGAGEDRLSFRRTFDGNATTVIITGPRALLNRVKAYTSRKATEGQTCDQVGFQVPGYYVDWGDDDRSGTYVSPLPPLSKGCPDPLKHVYTVPGSYRIEAGLYHLGPTDGPVHEWQEETSVTVEGEAPPLTLSVIGPARDEIIYFQEHLTVRWNLSTPKPVDLLVEIIGKDGVVLRSDSIQGLKYVGEGELTFYRLDEEPYWQHLLDEVAPVVARIHLQENGRNLLVQESPPFRLIAQFDPSRRGSIKAKLVSGRTVLLEGSYSSNCQYYRIEWGDGSVDRGYRSLETRHTYQKAGAYRIVLRMNCFGIAGRSLDNAPYMAFDTAVP